MKAAAFQEWMTAAPVKGIGRILHNHSGNTNFRDLQQIFGNRPGIAECRGYPADNAVKKCLKIVRGTPLTSIKGCCHPAVVGGVS